MNILLPVTSFHHLTGAEMYVYELGRELVGMGHRVAFAIALVIVAVAITQRSR